MDLNLAYEPDRGPLFEEGAMPGWLYLWSGTPGPARAVQVVVLADTDGVVMFEETGEWQDVEIVGDDQEDT